MCSNLDVTDPFLGQGAYGDLTGPSFTTQARDFVTNPAFLTAAGGVGGVYGAAAGLGAGAGASGAAGEGLAGGAAGGTGITPGAAGASGLSTTASGAGGISSAGAAGTSLSPGFFAAEGAGAGAGVGAGAAPASGGGSELLPPTAPTAPAPTPAAPAGGAPGGTGLSAPGGAAPASPPATGQPTLTGLPVGSGGAPAGGAPAPTPTPPAAPPSFVDKAVNFAGKNALPIAALGLNLSGQSQANKARKDAASQLADQARPASDASRALLSQGLSGQVPPAIMQHFDKSFNDRVGEINQRYANMGRDPKTDSAAQQEIAQAKQARDAQVANYANTLISQGLNAAGVASGPQTASILAESQQDKELQKALQDALNSIGQMKTAPGTQKPAGT